MFSMVAAAMALAACVLLGRLAPGLVSRMRPSQAVVLLAWSALLVSLASGIALTAIAVGVVARVAAVAADGHWSAAAIRAVIPVPGWFGALAAAAVLVLLARAGARATAIGVALLHAEQLCRSIRASGGPVVIVDDGSADAYTVAGLHGCVVISRRLLSELTAGERRVLTAHELSHLHRRHHLYVHLADVAAAANPLLRAVPDAVRLGVERWADEEAALGLGDRRATGLALARVALLRTALSRTTGGPAPAAAAGTPLGVGTLHVASRVEALLRPRAGSRAGRMALAAAGCVVILLLGLISLDHVQDAIDAAAPPALLHQA